MKRRDFFKNAIGISGLALVAPVIITTLQSSTAVAEESRRKKADAGSSDMVDPNDPTAMALEYVEDAKKNKKSAGNKCATCNFYTKADKKNGKEVGACTLFPKKFVMANGYCNSWAKKV